ncbi:MAG: hypothetical protein WCS91_01280 [Bacilli bacterium]
MIKGYRKSLIHPLLLILSASILLFLMQCGHNQYLLQSEIGVYEDTALNLPLSYCATTALFDLVALSLIIGLSLTSLLFRNFLYFRFASIPLVGMFGLETVSSGIYFFFGLKGTNQKGESLIENGNIVFFACNVLFFLLAVISYILLIERPYREITKKAKKDREEEEDRKMFNKKMGEVYQKEMEDLDLDGMKEFIHEKREEGEITEEQEEELLKEIEE